MNPELQDIINKEKARQANQLNLIPSENYTSSAVRQAVGSVMMHKYSEGYPEKRYYEGNQNIDELESLAIQKAKRLFKLPEDWNVNVQPLSGSNANLAVYNALLEPGDDLLSMYLYDGGHLSHGWQWKGTPVNMSAKFYTPHYYHVNPITGLLDYDVIAELAKSINPKIIISGGTAYPRNIDHEKMRDIAKSVGAYYLADIAHEAGLVAAGVYPNPVGVADVVTMTTHKTLRGPKGAMILSKGGLSKQIDRSVFPGMQGGPHNGTIAGIVQALSEASESSFVQYQKDVIENARLLADALTERGYDIVTKGTDKHLILIDLSTKGRTGKELAGLLAEAGIITNMNTVPGDKNPPSNPSGIRIGTPTITTRGVNGIENMNKIADWIESIHQGASTEQVNKEVATFLQQYPLPD